LGFSTRRLPEGMSETELRLPSPSLHPFPQNVEGPPNIEAK
jgi:hypothetical protein